MSLISDAPTPTGAAELAVPDIDEIMERILNYKIRLTRSIREQVTRERKNLERITNSYAFRNPWRLYEQKLEQLDRLSERQQRSLKYVLDRKKQLYSLAKDRLIRNHPDRMYQQAKKEFVGQLQKLQYHFQAILTSKQKEFTGILATLEALSPLKVMNRGYSIAYSGDRIVKSIHDVAIDDSLIIQVQDGTIYSRVTERKEKANDEE